MATKKQASGKKTSAKPDTKAKSTTRGNCLSLGKAGIIVQASIPGGPHPIDKSLEEVGLITANQRLIFREHVFDGVLNAGCHIDKSDIPNDADNTIRQVRDAIKDAAY